MPGATGVPPRAWPPTGATAVLRAEPADFRVEEELGFSPDGEGEHLLVRIEKRGLDTAEVAGLIARHLGLPRRAVSWAGRKDRHAVTTQWFGIHWSRTELPDLSALAGPKLFVHDVARHRRKLRPGALAGNRFRLRLTGVSGDAAAIDRRLREIAARGVPNYFGPQRFGRGGANVARARAALAGDMRRVPRERRSILLSAARSWLFNAVLAARVRDGSWERLLPGELAMLAGTASFFRVGRPDGELEDRLARHDISPSGPLPGRGGDRPEADALAVEEAALAAEPALVEGLERAGVKAARRPLRLLPRELAWHRETSDVLVLEFALPAGAFATAVVAELLETMTPSA